jgi:hypothetical protein
VQRRPLLSEKTGNESLRFRKSLDLHGYYIHRVLEASETIRDLTKFPRRGTASLEIRLDQTKRGQQRYEDECVLKHILHDHPYVPRIQSASRVRSIMPEAWLLA